MYFREGDIQPQDNGSLVLTWSEQPFNGQGGTGYIARSAGGSLTLRVPLGTSPTYGAVSGEEGAVFVQTDEGVTAIDAVTLASRWSVPADNIVASLAGGGVAVQLGDVTQIIGPNGAIASSSFAVADGVPQAGGGRLLNTGAGVSSQEGEWLDYAAVDWVAPSGSFLCKAPRLPLCTSHPRVAADARNPGV